MSSVTAITPNAEPQETFWELAVLDCPADEMEESADFSVDFQKRYATFEGYYMHLLTANQKCMQRFPGNKKDLEELKAKLARNEPVRWAAARKNDSGEIWVKTCRVSGLTLTPEGMGDILFSKMDARVEGKTVYIQPAIKAFIAWRKLTATFLDTTASLEQTVLNSNYHTIYEVPNDPVKFWEVNLVLLLGKTPGTNLNDKRRIQESIGKYLSRQDAEKKVRELFENMSRRGEVIAFGECKESERVIWVIHREEEDRTWICTIEGATTINIAAEIATANMVEHGQASQVQFPLMAWRVILKTNRPDPSRPHRRRISEEPRGTYISQLAAIDAALDLRAEKRDMDWKFGAYICKPDGRVIWTGQSKQHPLHKEYATCWVERVVIADEKVARKEGL